MPPKEKDADPLMLSAFEPDAMAESIMQGRADKKAPKKKEPTELDIKKEERLMSNLE